MSAITKTRIRPAKNNARYSVVLLWEHGDADHNDYKTIQLKMNDGEFLTWVRKFNKMAAMIEVARSYGKEDMVDRQRYEDELGIQIPQDCIYQNSNIPPSVHIDKIEWVDNEDIRYSVAINEEFL